MKVIDLLNKIANGEEVPNKIEIITSRDTVAPFYLQDNEYINNYTGDTLIECLDEFDLNNKVETIEEKPKHIEEINKSYPIFNFDAKSFEAMKDMLQDVYSKQVKIIKGVNYLLDKDK